MLVNRIPKMSVLLPNIVIPDLQSSRIEDDLVVTSLLFTRMTVLISYVQTLPDLGLVSISNQINGLHADQAQCFMVFLFLI